MHKRYNVMSADFKSDKEFDDLNFLQEGDLPDMDVAGDLNQTSQTNGGSDE